MPASNCITFVKTDIFLVPLPYDIIAVLSHPPGESLTALVTTLHLSESTSTYGGDTMHVDTWFAPGIGQVKMHYEWDAMTYHMVSHSELAEVNIK